MIITENKKRKKIENKTENKTGDRIETRQWNINVILRKYDRKSNKIKMSNQTPNVISDIN